jgi:cytochrome b561
MTIRNTEQGWGIVQQSLHWLIVALAFAQLAVGFVFADMPTDDPTRPFLFRLHSTIGLTILFVILIRFLWRLANPVPTLPDTLPAWQKTLARTNHYLLYLILIGMPIVGYLLVNASGHAVPFYTIQLPAIIGPNKTLAHTLLPLHIAAAFALMVLVALHIVGALRHEFVLKDNTLRRMTFLPWRKDSPKPSGNTGGS